MRTLKTLVAEGLNTEDCVWSNTIYIKVFSYLVGNTLGHEWNWDCMALGLRILENDFILLYVIFTLCLCLFFIY